MKMLVKTSDMSDNEYKLITQLTQIRYNNIIFKGETNVY